MAYSELYYNFREKLANEKDRYTGDIWHYTSSNGLKGILENHCLWFSDRRFLNDPTECNYIYNLIVKNRKLFENYNEKFNWLLQDIANRFSCTHELKSGIYIPQFVCFIASFSKSEDNLGLWNYYTKSQNSAGYAIKTDTKNIIKSLNKKKYHYIYGEVIYTYDRQVELLKELLDAYEKLFVEIHGKSKDVAIHMEFMHELTYILEFYNIFFKPEAYQNEQEYRFVIHCEGFGEDKNLNKKFRIFNDIFIPYVELDLSSNYIKEIMVSPSVNQKLLEQGVKLLKETTRFKKAQCSLSNIDKRY